MSKIDVSFSKFEQLLDVLLSIPGIGEKAAMRIANFLLLKDENYINKFCSTISNIRKIIQMCKVCHAFSESLLCNFCLNQNRDHSRICVVSNYLDLLSIENSQAYDGLYHVLHGEISIRKKIRPEDLFISDILPRIKKNNITELLLATNVTTDGETTAEYIKLQLADIPINIFRLGYGMPYNSNIDYADRSTIKYSIKNKIQVK